MDKLRKEIPAVVIMPFRIPESSLPEMIDGNSPTGYADGKQRRKERRRQERKNKKRK